MARARNIKPGFFRNAQLVELGFDRRILFAGLWTLADREGRLEDRPKQIKMDIFPADNVDVDKALTDLHDADLIQRYEVEGKRYIQITNFLKHQNPHHKEPPSTIPKPEALPPLHDHKTPDSGGMQGGSDLDSGCLEYEVNRGESRADPSLTVLIPDSLIPDSPSLIPDSGFPSKTKSRAKKRTNGENFHLPDWVPVPQWEAWIEARVKQKKPPTEWAKKLAVAKLEELRDLGHHPAAVLAQSAFQGWTDLYPVKVSH